MSEFDAANCVLRDAGVIGRCLEQSCCYWERKDGYCTYTRKQRSIQKEIKKVTESGLKAAPRRKVTNEVAKG